MKGVHRFSVKGKLAPRYVGPFKITEQCGPVAYHLELPSHLAAVHDVFHVSQLKKCLRVPEKSLTKSKDQLGKELLTFTKCNGVITPKKKQLGNKKNICKLISGLPPIYFKR
ncbi:hypothetical protein U9M48_035496, partial [Paspalum notatum var. saurae]